MQALDDEPEWFRDYVQLLLLTAHRRANVAAMRWADLDLERAVWTIPASETKMGRELTVPLVRQAVEILQRRRDAAQDETFVFSANSKSGHIVNPAKRWRAFRKRAGVSDLRLHDLRHTSASLLIQENIDPDVQRDMLDFFRQLVREDTTLYRHIAEAYPVIRAALGHAGDSGDVSLIYARTSTDALREALQRVADAMT